MKTIFSQKNAYKSKFFGFVAIIVVIAASVILLNKSVTSEAQQASSAIYSQFPLAPSFSHLQQFCNAEVQSSTPSLKTETQQSGTNTKNILCSEFYRQQQEFINANTESNQPLDLIDITLKTWQDQTTLQLSPWPEINANARLAKVPVIMYHDILPQKEVFFDVTPEELEAHFQLIQDQGLTPISLNLLIAHLRSGIPLPEKPILLTFDDGYGGHYQYVYPLMKKYGYPAIFSIYIKKMEGKTGRTSVTWEQLKEMASDPLVTIVSHSVTHPRDLTVLSDDELRTEIIDSKHILEKELGIPIDYFTYPEGKADARVKQWVIAAGYRGALSMNDLDEHFAGESPDLLTIGRFGQSRLSEVIEVAWGGSPLPRTDGGFNFNSPIHKQDFTVDNHQLTLISGGRPTTFHADSRYQVPEIIAGTGAEAAVDGGFFSLESLNSNVMIGPVLSHNTGKFIPGSGWEIPIIKGRPLVLITANWVKFIPFNSDKHNTLDGIMSEAANGETITDAFVAAAWLVKDNEAQPPEAFGNLYSFDIARNRAFWGINQAGQPVVGVSKTMIDSVSLGKILQQLGLRDAVMVDSGASTSLAYKGESVVPFTPRPVPHVVALFPPIPTLPELSDLGLPCMIYEDSCPISSPS
ncbi:polysaccharide deacetylase family protein [Gloeothece verrucosa]|uniref:Polysaccharide deacetylase n=1 Tax=Gloeothece verrucosa (strain PCC 7822) TaxID=497965 RepID=E0U7T5_GLOV7|nr:polysaccharide deacetylase family protein [Gloeothece verrucosa]ADN14897.1 polysaccharide deacetylase [Gloeothece verrucosa PCC 7822]